MRKDKSILHQIYGKYLLRFAQEDNKEDQVYKDLLRIKKIFETVKPLRDFLQYNYLDLSNRLVLLETVFRGSTNIVKKIFEVIYFNGHISETLSIIEEFEKIYHEFKNIVKVKVKSAIPLTIEQKKRLSFKITKIFSYKQAKICEEIDTSIIGGIVLEFNYKIIDGSIKNQLIEIFYSGK